MKAMKIGFVGVGSISGIYLENISKMYHNVELYAVCDLVKEKALQAQEKYNIPKLYDTMEELFADPQVDIVLNITRPYEHYEVTKAALLAGKPVYSEKPLAATVKEGAELVALAKEKGLLLGGAPDTYMGAGIQTCKKLIQDGYIGKPIGAAAKLICHGHESWHPDPAFYYQHGGGPMMDMGPYYVTALVNLLGRVQSTMSVAKTSFATRTITSQPHYGEVIQVEVPTHVNGILNFASGAVGTIITSFDVYYKADSPIEIYGSEGTLYVPDPNTFHGPVKLLRPEDGEIKEVPLCFGYKENSRGRGLSEMAQALEDGKMAFSCDCTQTFHVLQIMEALTKGGSAQLQ
ncbi:MAG: Gfo/Idh/MocA family oxidoreductase [Angelakisella sp.]